MSAALLSVKQVQAATTLSRTTLWRMARAGTFPAPVRLSPGRVAWRQDEVDAWVASRERRAA